MKNYLVIFFTVLYGAASAQESALKAGANLTFPFKTWEQPATENEFHPVFPGLNLSYERSFGKRFSWLVNFDFTHRADYYYWESQNAPYTGSIKVATSAFYFTPEIRVYFLQNQGLFYYKNQGLFLQLGLSVVGYEFEKSGDRSNNYPVYPFYGKYYPSVPFGMGVKYPLNASAGLEFNVQTNINNMDAWWPLQVGVKYYWMKEKKESAKPSPPEIPDVNESYFKAGAAFNTVLSVAKDNSGWAVYYPSYPSLNFSYEKSCGNRTAFALNFEPVRKSMHFDNAPGDHTNHTVYDVTQFSFIPELRVYLGNKYAVKSFDHGFFLQAGFELFHYAFWSKQSPQGPSSGAGFSLYPDNLNGWFERNVPFGFGYKMPLKQGQGLELNLNTNFMQLVDDGWDQTLTFGVKYFWLASHKK